VYDRHVVRAARSRGLRIAIASVASAREVIAAVGRERPRVVLADSIAFGPIADALPRLGGVALVALAHMPVRGRGARVLARADHVIAVSAALARELRARRVSVIRPGCDGVPQLPRRRSGPGLRVLCVANQSRAKGIDVLLRACARVPSVQLELVGDVLDARYADSLRPLVSRLSPRVSVRAAMPPSRLARSFARADIVAVPSRSEGYGIAASEATAHGLPVVASDLAALREVLGDAGTFVRPDDVPGLARALASMGDARARGRRARAARRRAAMLPRWSDAERSVVSLLVRVMRMQRPGGDDMPPRGVKSPKRKRQYEHIKKSELKRGRSNKTAERIAAATTNKTRRTKGETKKRTSSRKKKS
jgi:glycosyltransferase involved in cell wall biosynthesis